MTEINIIIEDISVSSQDTVAKQISFIGQLDETNVDEKAKLIYALIEQAPQNLHLLMDFEKLKVSFFGPFYGAYNIIALDKPYYNYVMICGPNKSYLWILARTPQLTYPIKQHLIAQAKELGFDTDKLIYVKQSSEVIEYKAGPHVN